MKGFVGAVVLVAGVAGAAQAQDGPWRGAWQVEGSTRTRSVVDGGKRGWVAVEVEVEGVPVRCEGPETFTMLGLTGELPKSKGLAGVLRGDGSPGGPTTVRLEVRPEPDAKDGQVSATASLFHGVRELWRERWTRPGPAGLELVTVRHRNGAEAYAPVDGPLEVQVRVLGRAQEVSVDVIVAPGSDDPRPKFYGEELVRRERPIAAFGGRKLEVGLHTISWHGRDLTKDERFVLAGQYRLRVDSPERRAAAGPRGDPAPERTLAVAKPWALVHMPFEQGARPVARSLDGPFQVGHRTEALTGAQTIAIMKRAAVFLVDTHGSEKGFMTGDGTGLYVNKAAIPSGHSLRDVHSVFITACSTGAPGEDGIPGHLIAAGVDVVVAMDTQIVDREADDFHEALAPRLLKYGTPLETVVKESARESYSKFWGWRGDLGKFETIAKVSAFFGMSLPAWLAEETAAAIRKKVPDAKPIAEVVRVHCAPGIDKQTETLMPPRHGCSTN